MATTDGAGVPGRREDVADAGRRELVCGAGAAVGASHGGDEVPGGRMFTDRGPITGSPFGCGDEILDDPWRGEVDPGAEWPFEYGDGEAAEGWRFDSEWDGEEPPEPQWALDASQQLLRERLAAAASSPAGLDTAGVIEALTPDGRAAEALTGGAGVGPAGLVDGVVATQRLINHYQAVQRQWLAALARPGVAVPLRELVDACIHRAGRSTGMRCPLGDLPDDLPVDGHGDTDFRPLLTHPGWAGALVDTAARLAAAEVGCALHLAPVTARIRVEDAITVIDTLPVTHAAQHTGDVDGYRAGIIADRTAVLDPHQRRQVERQVVPSAGSRAAGVLRDQVDRAVIGIDPRAAERRVQRAKAGRGVQVDKDVDDMAVFRALLHCADAQLAFGVLDEQARSLTAAGLADGRGVSQLRADVLTDLFRTLADTGHAHLTTQPTTGDGTDCHTDADSDPDRNSDGSEDETGDDPALPDSADTDYPDTADRATPDQADTGGAGFDGDGSGDGATVAAGSSRPGRFSGVQTCHGHCDHTRHGRHRVSGPGGRAGTVAGHRRSTALNLYVHAATLAGLDDLPAELAGHGVITAGTARALAASADTIRALITRPIVTTTDHAVALHAAIQADPAGGAGTAVPGGLQGVHSSDPVRARVCGTALDAGRSVYRPPDAVCDYVTARDRTCAWPGCRAPGRRCDADHRHPYSRGGATCPCNMDLLCRFHHQVKTFTGWRAETGSDGQLVWVSPTGHRYPTNPGHPLLDTTAGAHPPGRSGIIRVRSGSAPPRGDIAPDDGPPPF